MFVMLYLDVLHGNHENLFIVIVIVIDFQSGFRKYDRYAYTCGRIQLNHISRC